jgi:hypothetical protein
MSPTVAAGLYFCGDKSVIQDLKGGLIMNELALVTLGVKLLGTGCRMQLAADFNTMATNFASVVATVLSSIGVILCLWGGFNFAMSLEARDNNQRIQGAITFFSGILLLVLPQIVNYISGTDTGISSDVNFGG